MDRERVYLALQSARSLNEFINVLTEEELEEALRIESESQRRPTTLERLVTRLSALRAFNEKLNLMKRYTPWRVNRQSS